MGDIREFTGYAPTHCTICGSKWKIGCKPPCVNAPAAAADLLDVEEGYDAGPWNNPEVDE